CQPKPDESENSMAENKTKPTTVSVTAFIDDIADANRRADAKALVKLMKKVTGKSPKMWGPAIVGFDSYHYTYESGREGDAPLAAFSPRKAANVVYLMGDAKSSTLLTKLGKHKLSGGCVHIMKLADVDQAILERLVAESAEWTRKRYPQA